MKTKKAIYIFLYLLVAFAVINANEVMKKESAAILQVKFNFNDKQDNEADKIKNDVLKLRNIGISFIASGTSGLILSIALTCVMPVISSFAGWNYFSFLVPLAFFPIFGFMTILGILLTANSSRYLNKGKIFKSIDRIKTTWITLSAVFGSLTLCGIATGILYYIFYYNIWNYQALWGLATVGVLLLSVLVPLAFFMCALPMMITGIVFSNLKKRVSTVSYLDTERFAFTNGFSVKF